MLRINLKIKALRVIEAQLAQQDLQAPKGGQGIKEFRDFLGRPEKLEGLVQQAHEVKTEFRARPAPRVRKV